VLYEEGLVLRNEPIVFDTRSGTLTAKPSELGIQLDFPQRPVQPVPAPAQLEEALGTGWRFVGQSADDLLVELDSEAAVRSLRPQFDLLGRIPNARGVIVTSDCEADEFDFVSRFFAPAAGIAEDPVTGSAHCSLGPFWGERLHKDVMVGYQASPRGGVVHVSLKSGRALLAGAAVTVTHGELLAT
jgi:predicted PhzF superfamily epimerase YddE/YHI9